MHAPSPARAAVVLSIVAAALLGLVGRVAHLQTGLAGAAVRADRQHHRVDPLPARRGGVFDRNGLLMAGSRQVRGVFVDPAFLHEQAAGDSVMAGDVAAKVDRLAALLGRDPFGLATLLADRREARYVVLADKVDDATADAVAALDLPGVGFTPAFERVYPMGDLAAHVLGGVGADGHGLEGLEHGLDGVLAGVDGRVRTQTDARGRPLAVAADDYRPATPGRQVVLTIDSTVQLAAEQELASACVQYGAESGDVVVMDPRTGGVLAMASWPTFDPADPGAATPDVRRARALTDPYEPGSTLKPVTVAAALTAGITAPAEVFPVDGPVWRTPYGRRITDVHAYDRLALWDVLVKSSNIGMSMLAERMGNERLRAAVTAFGLGRKSGIDLPGEGPGRVSPLADWTKYSTDSVAQGYELLATPLQMCRAMACLANGGLAVVPHVVAGELGDDGRLAGADARTVPIRTRVVPADVAATVLRILADVPERGTAKRARLNEWRVFGKTGTAHAAYQGKYDTIHYVASFVGGAPLDDPRLVIAVVVRHPDKSKSHFGGVVAAPAAGRILERALTSMHVPKSADLPPPPANVGRGGPAARRGRPHGGGGLAVPGDGGRLGSEEDHRVAVAEEAVSLAHGDGVDAAEFVEADARRDEGEQRAAGQVEVRHEGVDVPPDVRGADESGGRAGRVLDERSRRLALRARGRRSCRRRSRGGFLAARR